MHKKFNTNKPTNFIQGLKPLSSTIPSNIKKILKKNGYNFSYIVDNWTKILGDEKANYCYPSKIKINKDAINGILVINVVHGKELEIEYFKKNLIDKINTFFGYNYISSIKLNSIAERKKDKTETSVSLKNLGKFENELSNVSSAELKNSLTELVKAYGGKNKKNI